MFYGCSTFFSLSGDVCVCFQFSLVFCTILALQERPVFCAYTCLFDLAPVCQIRGFSQMSGDPWFLFVSEREIKGLQRDLYASVELVHPCGLNGQQTGFAPRSQPIPHLPVLELCPGALPFFQRKLLPGDIRTGGWGQIPTIRRRL